MLGDKIIEVAGTASGATAGTVTHFFGLYGPVATFLGNSFVADLFSQAIATSVNAAIGAVVGYYVTKKLLRRKK